MITLDCRSLPCPQPVVKCKENIAKYSPRNIKILVDNKPALENVSRFLEKHEYVLTVVNEGDNFWCIDGIKLTFGQNQDLVPDVPVFEKGNVPQSSYEDYVAALTLLENEKKTIVFLTSDCVGHGDDVLGEKLMENFLSCLKEMHLWQIILLNGGVRLTAKEGKALESLRALEANGVKVLVCGACLSHYGIYEEKKVGETTNMLDIVTALDLADKVIKP